MTAPTRSDDRPMAESTSRGISRQGIGNWGPFDSHQLAAHGWALLLNDGCDFGREGRCYAPAMNAQEAADWIRECVRPLVARYEGLAAEGNEDDFTEENLIGDLRLRLDEVTPRSTVVPPSEERRSR